MSTLLSTCYHAYNFANFATACLVAIVSSVLFQTAKYLHLYAASESDLLSIAICYCLLVMFQWCFAMVCFISEQLHMHYEWSTIPRCTLVKEQPYVLLE